MNVAHFTLRNREILRASTFRYMRVFQVDMCAGFKLIYVYALYTYSGKDFRKIKMLTDNSITMPINNLEYFIDYVYNYIHHSPFISLSLMLSL